MESDKDCSTNNNKKIKKKISDNQNLEENHQPSKRSSIAKQNNPEDTTGSLVSDIVSTVKKL